ncbi:hypothetical protein M0Q50_00960 [bacterium]|jgi:predicted DNA-binding protein|nr:hypothetical protein [bacterium]
MKSIKIKTETHEKLKFFCENNNKKIVGFVDEILLEYIENISDIKNLKDRLESIEKKLGMI